MENLEDKFVYTDDIYYLKTFAKKIKVFIEKIENGEIDYCEELAIKIRICLMNKSGKKPFLEKVMFRNSINIFVHKPEPMSDFIKLKASLCYSANAELWFSDLPKKNMAPILEVFNSTEISIKFGDNLFSFKDIIEDLGDKFGGAHIDEKIDRKKLLVFSNSIIIRGFNINSSVTLCTGKSLLIAIEKIIKFIETGVVDDFLVKT